VRAYAKSGDTNTLVSDIKHSYEYDKTGNLTKKTEASDEGRTIVLYTVSKLLGHKDINMSQRYAHH